LRHGTEKTISGVHVSPGTLVRRRGIRHQHVIVYSLSNISARNYKNRLMQVEVIKCNISVVFLRHSVCGHPSACCLVVTISAPPGPSFCDECVSASCQNSALVRLTVDRCPMQLPRIWYYSPLLICNRFHCLLATHRLGL